MENQQAKEKIKELIARYEKLSDSEIRKYNEQQTKDHFIRPFFEALGWNFQDDVWSETDVHGKRVDYAFLIGGITKFFVEAKSLKVDLDIEAHAKQAINYSWNKGVAWAVLTDFESVKVFNAQAQSKLLMDKLVFEIPYKEYISDFDRLWLLSKESFNKNTLEEYAIKHGKKLKKLTVNEKLYSDLRKAREILTKTFGDWEDNWKNGIDKELLDEGVQRILDRLVFIRVLEDRKLEDPILFPLLRDWEAGGKSKQFFQMLIKKFRELDDTYNSNLFTKHPCEKWEEYSHKMWHEVISLLYGSSIYEYDFKEIPADILGGVYESYLSYIAQNPINVETRRGASLRDDKKELKIKSRKKRKEQGIYYTPKFIVDYIVKNTLGKKLGEAKNINDLKQIKVLDPACGSGSFLTRALEEMNNKYKDFGNPGNQYTKTEILIKNIYGVDLDGQAVELAKLNLLIDCLDQKAKLPDLTGNIRVGNSLISGTDEELKKYFGKNYRDKKPFNWEEEFSGVFAPLNKGGVGGFDVIIGNPPYVRPRHIDKETKKYLWSKSSVVEAKSDLYAAFIERGLFLLKNKGLFSYIVPHTWLGLESFKSLRKLIFSQYKVNKIVVTPKKTFASAQVETIIFVIEKSIFNKEHQIEIYEINDLGKIQLIGHKNQIDYNDGKVFDLSIGEDNNLLGKIEYDKDKLGTVVDFYYGIKTGDDEKFLTKNPANDKEYKKLLRRSDFDRYKIKFDSEYVYYRPDLMKKNKLTARPGDPKRFEEEKIIIMDIAKKLVCTLDNEGYYIKDALILKKKNVDLRFLVAIINSKLLNYYYLQKYKVLSVAKNAFLDLPIPRINSSDKKIIFLVDKMLALNKQLQSIPEHSDKWNGVKKEIEKTDKEIDKRVFELYGLGEEEIKIIKGK